MATVELRGIRKSFGDVNVIGNVDLKIEDGEFVVFVGPSGCGKSTLLRMIAGLEDINAGDIFIDGERMNDVPSSKRGLAMVFQSYALYPNMTLYENMAFGLKLANKPKDEIDAAVRQAAKTLHIDHLLDRKPKALSGGQRQRVAIGRAITRKPRVFLFDEPLSNLDAALRTKMRIEFSRLHDELKTTMIYVTHDQIEAITLADRIVVLSQGKIEQVGSPLELYHRPANLFVAGFIGSPRMNFIEGVLSTIGESSAIKLRGGETIFANIDTKRAKVGEEVTVGIRPEHVALPANQSNIVNARTTLVEPMGDSTLVYLEVTGADDGLTVRASAEFRIGKGDRTSLSFPEQHCHLFDQDGKAFPRTLTA
jgi:multiple sugar transport system ATP-binding protein